MFHVISKTIHGARQVASFDTYDDAEDYLCTLLVALDMDYTYIHTGYDLPIAA